jgi:hypothetical protein
MSIRVYFVEVHGAREVRALLAVCDGLAVRQPQQHCLVVLAGIVEVQRLPRRDAEAALDDFGAAPPPVIAPSDHCEHERPQEQRRGR